MLSSVLVAWTAVVVAYLCPQDMYAVVVTTTLNVVTDVNKKRVIIPCEYRLEIPNQKCNFRWDRVGDVVIVNDTLDQIFYGDKYFDRVSWGFGCSLILLNPGLNDTGRYTFRASAPHDRNDTDSGHTNLIVEKISTREKTTADAVTSASQSAEHNLTICTVSAEDAYTCAVWMYGPSIPVTIIGVIALVSKVVALRCFKRKGATDIRHRLLLGSSISLFLVGIITGLVGISSTHVTNPLVTDIRHRLLLGSSISLFLVGIFTVLVGPSTHVTNPLVTVSACSVCLGIAIYMTWMCCVMKQKAFYRGKADRNHGEDGNKTNLENRETLLIGGIQLS